MIQNVIDNLLKCDQLTIEHKSGKVFVGYTEPKIKFKPSYKFTPNASTYSAQELNPSKNRSPAWCDRILYKEPTNTNINTSVTHSIEVLYYKCIHGIFYSDHRPVVGLYKVTV